MTAEQIELMKTAARTLIAHHDAGRKCDPEGLRWARAVLRNNPSPQVAVPFDDDVMVRGVKV